MFTWFCKCFPYSHPSVCWNSKIDASNYQEGLACWLYCSSGYSFFLFYFICILSLPWAPPNESWHHSMGTTWRVMITIPWSPSPITVPLLSTVVCTGFHRCFLLLLQWLLLSTASSLLSKLIDYNFLCSPPPLVMTSLFIFFIFPFHIRDYLFPSLPSSTHIYNWPLLFHSWNVLSSPPPLMSYLIPSLLHPAVITFSFPPNLGKLMLWIWTMFLPFLSVPDSILPDLWCTRLT